jgi:hypothetical protein
VVVAPVFLVRCLRCLQLHPWRKAPRDAPPVDRVTPHKCPHGFVCGARLCIHGRPYSEVRVRETENGTQVLGCEGGDPCIDSAPSCPQCAEIRAEVFKSKPQSSCIVCREAKRQGGSGCPLWGSTTKDGWQYHKTKGLCKWRTLEIVSPWCAGATEDERQLFLSALPGEVREKAIAEAQKANFQEGAKQQQEAPKKIEKKRGNGQTSMF